MLSIAHNHASDTEPKITVEVYDKNREWFLKVRVAGPMRRSGRVAREGVLELNRFSTKEELVRACGILAGALAETLGEVSKVDIVNPRQACLLAEELIHKAAESLF